jgi:hypothetical protein
LAYALGREAIAGSSAVVTADTRRTTGAPLVEEALPETTGTNATLRFDLPSNGGTIVLDSVTGANANIILYARGGAVSGTIDVASLTLIGTNGSSQLYGFVANTTGPEAAHLAAIKPDPSATYRLNACPIGSVNCVLIPLAGLPPANPLRDYVIDAGRQAANDDDVTLPDVSSRDY